MAAAVVPCLVAVSCGSESARNALCGPVLEGLGVACACVYAAILGSAAHPGHEIGCGARSCQGVLVCWSVPLVGLQAEGMESSVRMCVLVIMPKGALYILMLSVFTFFPGVKSGLDCCQVWVGWAVRVWCVTWQMAVKVTSRSFSTKAERGESGGF